MAASRLINRDAQTFGDFVIIVAVWMSFRILGLWPKVAASSLTGLVGVRERAVVIVSIPAKAGTYNKPVRAEEAPIARLFN